MEEKRNSRMPEGLAPHGGWRQGLFWLASMRLGTAILAAMILALGAATAIESSRGTEQALHRVYQSPWFMVLLALLGVNMLAAVVLRWPLQRKQLGFVLTHVGVVVILAGAWTTRQFGMDGKLTLAEGQSRDSFVSTQQSLAVMAGGETAMLDLDPPIGGLRPVENPQGLGLTIPAAATRVEIERFVPDAEVRQRTTNDAESPSEAIEVVVSQDSGAGQDRSDSAWVFEGATVQVGTTSVTYRSVGPREMVGYLAGEDRKGWIAAGRVVIDYAGEKSEIPLAECLAAPVAIGQSGYQIKGVNVWTHASVGGDGLLGNVSPLPTNPAIELNITRADADEVVDHRLVFAEYPDFDSDPQAKRIENMKVRFSCPVVATAKTDVEIVRGPDDRFFARFAWEGTPEEVVGLAMGASVETPWPGRSLAVLKRFTHAKVTREIVVPERVRPERVPALRVAVRSGEAREVVWVRRGMPVSVRLGDQTVQLAYTGSPRPLGFSVKLERFRIGHYPGTKRPRSFESLLVFTDPTTGRSERRLVSMNHPTTYGGLTFFQSSYQMDHGATRSVLSVSHDPGMMVTFVGYVGTFLGMVLVLVSRMRDRRHGLPGLGQVVERAGGGAVRGEAAGVRIGGVEASGAGRAGDAGERERVAAETVNGSASGNAGAGAGRSGTDGERAGDVVSVGGVGRTDASEVTREVTR